MTGIPATYYAVGEPPPAVLTCTIFAYSLEINGAAAMGAGALEAPTTKLRDYPVLDIRDLKATQRTKLVSLAKAVWTREAPVDWASQQWQPGINLKALDEWLLTAAGRNVPVAQMYDDLRSACLARAIVAYDKKRKTKSRSPTALKMSPSS